MVKTLQIDPENLSRALVRLSLEKLVTRRDDGSFVSTPITVEAADRMFDARCAIQVGVADAYVQDIKDEQIAALRGLPGISSIVDEENPDLTRFLDVSHQYHSEFVGLSTTTTSMSSECCVKSSPTTAARSDGIRVCDPFPCSKFLSVDRCRRLSEAGRSGYARTSGRVRPRTDAPARPSSRKPIPCGTMSIMDA